MKVLMKRKKKCKGDRNYIDYREDTLNPLKLYDKRHKLSGW